MELLDLAIPARVAYREADSLALPVHRHNKDEKENIPQWADKFQAL